MRTLRLPRITDAYPRNLYRKVDEHATVVTRPLAGTRMLRIGFPLLAVGTGAIVPKHPFGNPGTINDDYGGAAVVQNRIGVTSAAVSSAGKSGAAALSSPIAHTGVVPEQDMASSATDGILFIGCCLMCDYRFRTPLLSFQRAVRFFQKYGICYSYDTTALSRFITFLSNTQHKLKSDGVCPVPHAARRRPAIRRATPSFPVRRARRRKKRSSPADKPAGSLCCVVISYTGCGPCSACAAARGPCGRWARPKTPHTLS